MDDAEGDLYKPPAFQFYPDDFVAETADLTTEEIGAYVLLICRAWKKGAVPNDIAQLARIARLPAKKMKRAWMQIEPRFVDAAGTNLLIQPRLEKVRSEAREYAKTQRSRGKAGASERWRKHRSSNAQALPEQSISNAKAMPGDSSPVSILQLEPNGSGETPNAPPPKARRGPSETDLAAYRILGAAWPVIKSHAEMGLTQKAWRQRNKAAAVDLVELGRTPEDVVAMLEVAYDSKFYSGITTLAKLQEHWPKLVALEDAPEDPEELRRRLMRGDFLPRV